MNEKLEFYVKEQRNNNERQGQISMADRQATKLRMQYEEAEKIRLLYENEVSLDTLFFLPIKLFFLSYPVYDV
jgi:hypothetical protein